VGLVINNAVLYIANERYRIHFYLSKLIAIGVTTIWNFTINFLFVF
jgi:putative flippase GtrA